MIKVIKKLQKSWQTTRKSAYISKYNLCVLAIVLLAALDFAMIAAVSVLVISRAISFAIGLFLFTLKLPLIYLSWRRFVSPLATLDVAMYLNDPKTNPLYRVLEQNSSWKDYSVGRILFELSNSYRQEYSSNILDKQAELYTLQSQINPHFLYNTLESIRGKAYAEGQNDIAEMTEALSSFFRYSISRKGNTVTMEEELINVRNYFKIQQFRFDNRFNLDIRLQNRDELIYCRLPKLTLQPLVENAIYHGLEEKMGQGRITISAFATDARIVIKVSDNGIGIPEDTLAAIRDSLHDLNKEPLISDNRNTGIALNNVNRRIKLLYGETFGLSINSTLGFGTDLEITIPLVDVEDSTGELLPI